MANAICGRTCSFTIGSADYNMHNVDLNQSGNRIDSTTFGDGQYGDTTICGISATITGQCYDNLVGVLSIGDSVALSLTLAYSNSVAISMNGVVGDIRANIDAKGIVGQTVDINLIGDPTIA